MPQFKLTINKTQVSVNADPDMPLLWVVRDLLGLTGTKYSCGGGYCGACTVHMDGKAIRSCITPVSTVGNASIITIEGLAPPDRLHPVQQAWIEQQVAQCGYCQAGQIMSAAALLAQTPHPTDREITAAMQGNLCRCGSYPRIKKAIQLAAKTSHEVSAFADATPSAAPFPPESNNDA